MFNVHYICEMNTFSKRIEGGVYVYGLTNNDVVFYVGISGWPLFRYSQHFTDGLCRNYIYWMRKESNYPGIVIFGIFDKYPQAEAVEHSLICHFARIGNKLCNNNQNPYFNRIIQCIPDKWDKLPKMPPKLSTNILNKAIESYYKIRLCQQIQVYDKKEFPLRNTPTSITQY